MKIVKRILLCLLLIIGLTGCMKYNITMKVDEQGKVQSEVEVLVQEEFLNEVEMTTDDFIQELENSLKEQYQDKLNSITMNATATTKTIDNVNYVGAVITMDDKIQDANVKIENNKMTMTLPLDDFDSSEGSLDDLGDLSELKDNGMEINLVVEMPNDLTSNVGNVEGNKVTIDLLDVMYNQTVDNIVVSCDLDEGLDGAQMVMIAIGVGIVIGVLVFVLKKRKRDKEDKDELEDF